MKIRNLILVRHGQSEWNEKNLFTGWENPGLTEKGSEEAKNAGILIKQLNIKFDCLFTSALIRAQLTGSIILDKIDQTDLNIIKNSLRLNETGFRDLIRAVEPSGISTIFSFNLLSELTEPVAVRLPL